MEVREGVSVKRIDDGRGRYKLGLKSIDTVVLNVKQIHVKAWILP